MGSVAGVSGAKLARVLHVSRPTGLDSKALLAPLLGGSVYSVSSRMITEMPRATESSDYRRCLASWRVLRKETEWGRVYR
jgi:hypothetical protein